MKNMPTSQEQGIVNLSSRKSVTETAQRLAGFFESRGMTVFARIDQSAAANAGGLDMKPMVLLLIWQSEGGNAFDAEVSLPRDRSTIESARMGRRRRTCMDQLQ